MREGRQVYVALESAKGPHVTPELYTWSDGRLWFPAATSTLKARVIDDGSRLAAAVVGRGSTVIFEGVAELFDPRRPSTILRASAAPRMLRALTSFGVRNTSDLLGFARDTVKGDSVSRIPNARLFICVAPERMALIENDRVAWQSGWHAHVIAPPADVPSGGEPAVAAFDGPRIAPARWFADDERAFVSPDVLALHGVSGDTGVAVVVDHYNAPGPAAKQGVLVRGDGVVDDNGWIDVTARRTVAWDGAEVTPQH